MPTPTIDLLALISDDKSQISYRPRWNQLTGSICATILLQQVIYRWIHSGRRPFYKFNNPCDHRFYRPGDSWQEELGMTRREFEGARKAIAQRTTKGRLSANALVSYWMDANHVSWYAINEQLLVAKLSALYPVAEGGAGIQTEIPLLPDDLPDAQNVHQEIIPNVQNVQQQKAIVQNEHQETIADVQNVQQLMYKTCNRANVQNEHHLLTEITTKSTSEITTEQTTTTVIVEGKGDVVDVVVETLRWMGYVDALGEREQQLTPVQALAWATSCKLSTARNPQGATIATWRKEGAAPPADMLLLAGCWLEELDDEDKLELLHLVAHANGRLYLPQHLLHCQFPTDTFLKLYRATNGQPFPSSLIPIPQHNPPEPEELLPLITKPSPKPELYKMPANVELLREWAWGEIELQMTKATFNKWLKNALLKVEGDTAVILCQNQYAADWIQNRLAPTIMRTLNAIIDEGWKGLTKFATLEAREAPELLGPTA